MNRLIRRPRPAAFTLVELLLVITIIVILIMMLLPVAVSAWASVNRMNCQLNLTKCQQILLQYASNNNSWLPSFGPTNNPTNNLETGITEGTEDTTKQFPLVKELKHYGATAAIFTCPASAAAQDHNYWEYPNPQGVSVWSTWDAASPPPEGNPPNGFVTLGSTKQVWTYGYAFFCRFNVGHNNHDDCVFLDGRQMPYKTSQDGSLPLAADMIAYSSNFADQNNYPSSPGNGWYGMAHEPNAILTQNLGPVTGGFSGQNYPQAGGGNVVFLNGTCQWFDSGQIFSGFSTTSSANIQPLFFGTYYDLSMWGFGNDPRLYSLKTYPQAATNTQYYFGSKPQSASAQLNN